MNIFTDHGAYSSDFTENAETRKSRLEQIPFISENFDVKCGGDGSISDTLTFKNQMGNMTAISTSTNLRFTHDFTSTYNYSQVTINENHIFTAKTTGVDIIFFGNDTMTSGIFFTKALGDYQSESSDIYIISERLNMARDASTLIVTDRLLTQKLSMSIIKNGDMNTSYTESVILQQLSAKGTIAKDCYLITGTKTTNSSTLITNGLFKVGKQYFYVIGFNLAVDVTELNK